MVKKSDKNPLEENEGWNSIAEKNMPVE